MRIDQIFQPLIYLTYFYSAVLCSVSAFFSLVHFVCLVVLKQLHVLTILQYFLVKLQCLVICFQLEFFHFKKCCRSLADSQLIAEDNPQTK